jgi:ribosomal peptide maturation radical SAM protein 1
MNKPASVLRAGDALIIVPPFASLHRPALGPHLLQACAKHAGFDVCVLYANALLAAEIGEANYTAVCDAPPVRLLGEALFAAAAYGVPPLELRAADGGVHFRQRPRVIAPEIDLHTLGRLERTVLEWVEDLVSTLVRLDFAIMGCTTTFQQTAASVALLQRIKRSRPEIMTILGGSNCEGEMAEGLLSLSAGIDFVFSGESEASFVTFLSVTRYGNLPARRTVIEGDPCTDLDLLPTPDFTEYFEQLDHLHPDDLLASEHGPFWLPYESSRGCWWGQKHHCTFCGLNGLEMKFRAKSPDRVLADLKHLSEERPSTNVQLVDNIMPHTYFRDVLPRLAKEIRNLRLFYEVKANLTLANVVALKAAGVVAVQPGIEALSSSLLRRMDKGVTARQNIALLRYARSAELSLFWNLLYGFPNDQLWEYEQTLALIPLLRHLEPPSSVHRLSIDRFSPFFKSPEKYGLHNVRPAEGYDCVVPEGADVAKLAYHFIADYPSASLDNPDLIRRISGEVEAWRQSWSSGGPRPSLVVTTLTSDQYMLFDTRGLPGTQEIGFLTRDQASLVLAGADHDGTARVRWALERRLVVEVEGSLVPLATADPDLIAESEAEIRGRAPLSRYGAPHALRERGVEGGGDKRLEHPGADQ